MAWIPVTLSELEGHWHFRNMHNSGNIAHFNNDMLTFKCESTCGLKFHYNFVIIRGFLKVMHTSEEFVVP